MSILVLFCHNLNKFI